MALRLDKAPIPKAYKTDNGMIRAPVTLTRVGVFEYRQPDGTVRRELRPPEEVFHADSLASFNLLPITNDHPWTEPEGVKPENVHAYVHGSIGNVRPDESKFFVHADAMLWTAEAVRAVEAGRREVSCGYSCEIENTPGEWIEPSGARVAYDGIQRNIRGNHVAIVDKGRAGPEARLRLDSAGVAVLMSVFTPEHREDGAQSVEKDTKTMKIVFDGIEIEVSEQAAQFIARERKANTDMLAAVRADADKSKAEIVTLTAKADAAEAKVKDLSDKLTEATDAKRVDALVAARVALVESARSHLGAEFKADGKTDDAIRREVLAKISPSIKLDGKPAEYVIAAFDAAISLAGSDNRATAEADAKIKAGRQDGTPAPATSPEAKLNEYVRNAYKGAAK